MFKKIGFVVKCAAAFVAILGVFLAGAIGNLAGAIGNLRGLMVNYIRGR